jgi:hypothetical protein
MKKIGILAISTLLFLSCSKKVEATDIDKMNGYWEIEKVVFPNGKEKKYGINEVYDYFQIKDFIGIRKKVTPTLEGKFLVNLDAEKVTVKEGKDKFIVHYATIYNQWDEELISISKEEMVLKNDNNTEYHYKRATPINILKNGTKTQ